MPHFDEVPNWEGEAKEFKPSTVIPEEVKKISAEARKSSPESTDKTDIKVKPYKVGDISLDDYPTDTEGFGINRPLTRQEMQHLESDPRYKKMSHGEQQAAIRKYIRDKDALERPN